MRSRDVQFDLEGYWAWSKEEKNVKDIFFENEDDELQEIKE